jgi:hypothetical protein
MSRRQLAGRYPDSWHNQRETCPFSDLRVDEDVSAVASDNAERNREPKPCASVLALVVKKGSKIF